MNGNDGDEDMMVQRLSVKGFLRTDCMIKQTGADVSLYSYSSFTELSTFVE